jgi:uncharacterized membrane protein
MVAMGTSLADKAWGRSSAVFRVSGVINVIGGWFFTAIVAFAASATFATCIYFFDITAIILLMLLAVFLISRTFLLHKKKEKVKNKTKAFEKEKDRIQRSEIIEHTSQKVINSLNLVRDVFASTMNGLVNEDRKVLKASKKNIVRLKAENETFKKRLYSYIKRIETDQHDAGRLYLLVYDLEQDIIQSISLIVKSSKTHVANSMTPLNGSHSEVILALSIKVNDYLKYLIDVIVSGDVGNMDEVLKLKSDLLLWIENKLEVQIVGIQSDNFGMRQSLLLFTIFLETKDMIAVAARFAKLYHRLHHNQDFKDSLLVKKQ